MKLRLALASDEIRLCEPMTNAQICADAAILAAEGGAEVIAFPPLTLTGATAAALYRQEALTLSAERALSAFIQKTEDVDILSFIGLPVRVGDKVYNAVCAVTGGEIIGVTLSSDVRSQDFDAAPMGEIKISICGSEVSASAGAVYSKMGEDGAPRVKIQVAIGGDMPYIEDGVGLVINPAAEAEYIGLAEERRRRVINESVKLGCHYAYIGAGTGESGTDGVYAGARLVATGNEASEAPLFYNGLFFSDVDIGAKISGTPVAYTEKIMKHPFVPTDPGEISRACDLGLTLQSRALAARLVRSYSKCAVLGVSGGLDSTLAVLVCAGAMDILGWDRRAVVAITMPCFGTTERTKGNALALAEELGCTVRTIDIKAAVTQHFADISHDAKNYNVVYENAQARERTQILMDVANAEGGLVVGTGDLSELALGFATYNGDHMSMYSVNGSIPKTLMRAMIKNEADKAEAAGRTRLATVLRDVISTPVSPELLPTEDKENAQHTEKIVGPYELHDFFLYYTVTKGWEPSVILAHACEKFPEYTREEISGYLAIFLRRFISQQFKRSCMPDGPRVTKISLSPRGAWRMPSDCSAAVFCGYFNT